MKLPERITAAKRHIGYVVGFIDVPEAQTQTAVDELKKFIDDQWTEAKKRRAEEEKKKALPL